MRIKGAELYVMRTYSLMNLRSRFALEGEELVAHRFSTGSIGMVSRCDFEGWRRSLEGRLSRGCPAPNAIPKSFLQSVKALVCDFLTYYGFKNPEIPLSWSDPGPAVGIPSEAVLRVFDISSDWQEQYQLGPFEDALFVEPSPISGSRHDALCFGNGITIPLEFLHEGQRVKVLRRSWAESLEPELVRDKHQP